ncbi:MAG: 3-oxoacyl-ACP reductase FabG, partial [Rhodospirillaceae bacterium]|nr:3-oxoacyl-ACP reductase FabG [Rhodospirillaceae bacterium]
MPITPTAHYPGLKGRVAIVTGGGQALGRAYARHLAAQGVISVIAEYNAASGARVAKEIEDDGGKALAIHTDVGDLASVQAMAEETLKTLGRIDILVNNAAVFSQITMAPFWELPRDEWKRAMDVNVTGAFDCARAVAPAMREAKWGRILNIASGTPLLGLPDYLHYITSKSAVFGMSRSMARELGPYGVTVNTFIPGVTKTEVDRPSVSDEKFAGYIKMQCLKRMSTPDDMAKVMVFLCSDEAAWITGQTILVDGGLNFI